MSQRNLGLISPMSWILGGIYLFVLLPLNVWSQIMDIPNLENWSKPILMLWLILIVMQGNINLHASIKSGLAAALFFSWLGDVSLLFLPLDNNLFVLGLGSFLIAHVFYILVMMRTSVKMNYNSFLVKLGMPVLLVYTIILLYILFPYLNAYTIPVVMYATVLLIMGIIALGRQVKRGYKVTLTGVGMFILSDSILAIEKFTPYLENQGAQIMTTYGLAQILILFGILSSVNPDSAIKEQEKATGELLLDQ